VFLDVCQEKGIQPEKTYSGKFNLRVDPELHHMIALAAKAEDVSINEWVKNRCVENLRQ
ncbi:MAG TPA: type II toxin-antitoxin system HicB family antitoxin, partial [Gammaproteobacteria bacterium]|nr:type II toxin-antitoxin system HicB family antitoxin [Gammaproteobacteria bacterium]